jgi:hypothetical protein
MSTYKKELPDPAVAVAARAHDAGAARRDGAAATMPAQPCQRPARPGHTVPAQPGEMAPWPGAVAELELKGRRGRIELYSVSN